MCAVEDREAVVDGRTVAAAADSVVSAVACEAGQVGEGEG